MYSDTKYVSVFLQKLCYIDFFFKFHVFFYAMDDLAC